MGLFSILDHLRLLGPRAQRRMGPQALPHLDRIRYYQAIPDG